MHYINDIRDIIGNTPLLKLNNITPNKDINIFAKLEYLNPGGSIKDRIGIEIIETAEKDGLLKPGSTIIEATAGNTGIGLALAAFDKGYKLIIVIPEKFSIEKQILMKALGAELIITPSDKGIEGAVEKAEKLLNEIPNSFMARQFDNPANLEANKKTGKEIYDALDGKVDVLVAGAGSGGTITGIAQYLKSKNPNIKIVLADPVGSILGGGESGTYKVEGIGNHFIPKIFDSSLIDDVEKIQDDEAMYFVRLLSKKEGVLAGSSSGAAVAGAVKQAYKAKEPINIVVILPDRSDRYFSQHLYDFNMKLSDFRFNALFDDWADEYDETVESKEGIKSEI
ncbi:MAG: cysteine synthase A [Clostridium sp.]|nr:cysteine synthase A [Clostridium sp.]